MEYHGSGPIATLGTNSYTRPACRRSLLVRINQQYSAPLGRQVRGDIHGKRRLSNAPLLIEE